MVRMPRRSDLDSALELGVTLARANVKAVTALPGAITAIAEAANNINATANEARAVIRRAQAVADRLDGLLDHVEPAVSELTPTLQALREAQQRIVAMTGSTEKLASFVDDAGAGLSKLAGLSGASGLFTRLAAAAKPVEAAPSALPSGLAPGPLVRGTARGLSAVPAQDVELGIPPEPLAGVLPPETPEEEVLAELVGAAAAPVDLDDGIEDAVLVQDETSAPEATG